MPYFAYSLFPYLYIYTNPPIRLYTEVDDRAIVVFLTGQVLAVACLRNAQYYPLYCLSENMQHIRNDSVNFEFLLFVHQCVNTTDY